MTPTMYFLFAMITGQADAAGFTTLGEFQNQQACEAAASDIELTIDQNGTALAHVFCVAASDVAPLAKAAQ
jgi:hypothetical protein